MQALGALVNLMLAVSLKEDIGKKGAIKVALGKQVAQSGMCNILRGQVVYGVIELLVTVLDYFVNNCCGWS